MYKGSVFGRRFVWTVRTLAGDGQVRDVPKAAVSLAYSHIHARSLSSIQLTQG